MKRLFRHIICSSWIRLALLVALFYGGQVSSYYHLHHSHDKNQPESVQNADPIEIDFEHTAGHSHHDGESHQGDQQADHHESLHQRQVHWHLNRAESSRIYTVVDQSVLVSASLFASLAVPEYIDIDDYLPTVVNYHASFKMFRGPPVLT